MTENNETAAVTTQTASAPLRKTSNLLALAVAAYRDGDVDTAFDLFISGMETHLREGETAGTNEDFGRIIETALSEALNFTESLHTASDEEESSREPATVDFLDEDFEVAELEDDEPVAVSTRRLHDNLAALA